MADTQPNLTRFVGATPHVVKALAASVPEAVSELLLSNSWTQHISKEHGRQLPFEVEICSAILRWMSYTNSDGRCIARELATGPRKQHGRSIDLAILKETGPRKKDLAKALIEVKVFADPPGYRQRGRGGDDAGSPLPFKVGNDLELLALSLIHI